MKDPIENEEWMLPYTIGALLYAPANNRKIAQSIIEEKFDQPYSMALCLEDAISDMAVDEAEEILICTLKTISKAYAKQKFYLPKIFIRVRNEEQIASIYERAKEEADLICGFIFPKFSIENGEEYCREIVKISEKANRRFYMLPIIESQNILELDTRYQILKGTRELLDRYREYVLNVRVGGNDFCKNLGIRRHVDETIYDIKCIADVLGDIVTYFARDYVVSAPVWEYFGPKNGIWMKGMQKELKQDRLNGFLGKTVIHPTQIAVVNESLKISREDYEDAKSIIHMAGNEEVYVEKNVTGNRMNEYKTHVIWARKTLMQGRIYGVKETCEKNIIPLSI